MVPEVNLEDWEKRSAEQQKRYKYYLEKTDKKKILKLIPDLHDAAFEKIDCLQCANCCRNYSPRFKMPDIKRISKYLRVKETELIDKYLVMDKEGDYVTKSSPCPFLGSDNFCTVYDARPTDCHRFPYTDEDVLFKKPLITLKNSSFCPAVFFVLEGLLANNK